EVEPAAVLGSNTQVVRDRLTIDRRDDVARLDHAPCWRPVIDRTDQGAGLTRSQPMAGLESGAFEILDINPDVLRAIDATILGVLQELANDGQGHHVPDALRVLEALRGDAGKPASCD